MGKLQKALVNYRSISLLLVAAICLNTLQSVHYHFHHLSYPETATHTHSIDVHSTSGESHHDETVHTFGATPEEISSKTNPLSIPALLLVVLLLLLPLIGYGIGIRPDKRIIAIKQCLFYLSPPLRAPPL